MVFNSANSAYDVEFMAIPVYRSINTDCTILKKKKKKKIKKKKKKKNIYI